MNQANERDFINYDDEGKAKMPTGINVLTILTFIGCAIELYQVVSSFLSGREGIQKLEAAQEKLNDAPAWARSLAGPEMLEYARKAYENRIPLFITGLVAIALCVYGAIEMRRLKKQGYILWLTGELLPVLCAGIFLGFGFYGGLRLFFLIIPLIFIILYTFQRKYLVK